MKTPEERLIDPAKVGINPDALQELIARCRKEVEEGLLPASQVALARHGKLVAFETFGDASNHSLFCVFSATKAITSAAAWLLIQDDKLDINRKIADVIPEFGANDKQDITIEQLFIHTAGFPHAPFRATDWFDKTRRLERFNEWTLNWEPGSRYEYHPTSSMWVIAELIERLSGEDFGDFVRNRIALPLELPDLWLGCPEEEYDRIAPVTHVGEPLSSEDYARLGLPEPPETEVTEEALLRFNEAETRQVPIAGGGGIMSAAELALFYQGLMGNCEAAPDLWLPETMKSALAVRTGELPDLLTGVPVNRALGVVIAGDERRNHRGFGHTNSPSAFGHQGAGGQLAWADPATGISLGYCTNGHDRNAIRQARRGVSISNRAAVCAD